MKAPFPLIHMSSLAYFLWQLNPTIAHPLGLEIRWYGLCFVLGFLLFPMLGRSIFQQAGKDPKDLDRCIHYVMLGTLLGARLGHVLFYEASYYFHHPLEILLPIRTYPRGGWAFTGFQGLASHGAVVGVLIALFLFTRRHPNYSFRWLMTPLAIGAALGCACIRIGNFTNSEIYGTPTKKPFGVFFAYPVLQHIQTSNAAYVAKVKAERAPHTEKGTQATLVLTLTNQPHAEDNVRYFLNTRIRQQLALDHEHIALSPKDELSYTLNKNKQGAYVARIIVPCIPRHPAQLYEAISCLILFLLLFLRWRGNPKTIRPGSYAGYFGVYVFTLRFLYEFIKTSQTPFPQLTSLTTPQLLSLLGIAASIGFLIWSKQPEATE